MAQELIYADFSGGMNAGVAVDKLQDNELLLAENIRLDEDGNASISGGSTKLNTTAYTDGTSTAPLNVHSIYYNPSIGAVAGVGNDVFSGATLGSLSDTLTAVNPNQSKMSFTSSPGRIYMDIGGAGYFIGGSVSVPTAVDWAPSGAASTVTTGPLAVSTSGTTTRGGSAPHWLTPQGVIGLSSGSATTQITSKLASLTDYVRAINPNPALNTTSALQGIAVTASVNVTSGVGGGNVAYQAILEISGVVIGSAHSVTVPVNSGVQTITWGNVTDLWTTGLTSSLANNATLGVRITCVSDAGVTVPVTCSAQNVQFTFTQGSGTGLVAGTGVSGALTGTYTWKVTFVSDNGEEGDASPASQSVVLSSQMGTGTFP